MLRPVRRCWLIAACAALGLPGVSAAREIPATLSVARNAVTRPIPQGFLGLAFEYSGVRAWVGRGTAPPNPVLVRLIRNLDPAGRPVIRIGGLSTDRSWWPSAGLTQPLGVTFALTPAWAQSLQSLARAVDAQLVLGVNLEADSPRLAQTEVDAFLTWIGRRYISALDLGNEPPLYPSVPWYRRQGGEVLPWYSGVGMPVFARAQDWGPAGFIRDYARILAALPRIPIAGPDTQRPSWFAAYDRFLSPRSRVRMIASHGYGLNNCVTNPAAASYPSIAHLLNGYALHDLLNGLTPYISAAHRNAATFRIDEMGSVTCNGRPRVSNTMASALWAAGALFSVARDGVDGVNLHSYPGLSNGLFDFTDSARGWSGAVHPLYYGALLFAQAAPAGSRLLHVTSRGPRPLHGWATTGPGRARHVVVLNDSLTDSAAVVVRAPRSVLGAGPAQLERLSAPSASATGDITLGGRSFGAATTTGQLASPVRDRVSARGGVYRVTVPPASAAVLSFSAR